MSFFPISFENCINLQRNLSQKLELFSSNATCVACRDIEITFSFLEYLESLCSFFSSKEEEDGYSKPMVWIGLYIVVASLFCILAMAGDLLHGFRNRKLWFPCKYFTLNAASITVITVAMKLPVDLNNPMPETIDQFTKQVSIYFLCVMMANLMPSLASMDNKQLLANVIGLSILVVTVIVNTIIEITTGNINIGGMGQEWTLQSFALQILVYVNMVMLVLLLIILISSAITIPTSKQILEFKYQAINEKTLNDQHPQDSTLFTVDKLIQHVRRYWVMTETGNPQFSMVSNPLSSAAGVICVFGLAIYICTVIALSKELSYYEYFSYTDYKWSMLPILSTQFFGVIVGIIAPIFRCFAALSSTLSIKWSRNHMKMFNVEKYWIQKLFEWKQIDIAFPLSGRRSRTMVYNLKNLILNLCIGFQKLIVVSCKMLGLIPIFLVIFFVFCLYCFKLLKAMYYATPITSIRLDTVHEHEQNDTKGDISNYVLQLQGEMELAKRTLKRISNSMNRLIQKAEKQQHGNLLSLLEKSNGFHGVENFDSDLVQPLSPLCVELVNSWSLPVVTLTCITIALPNIPKNEVDKLLSGVAEGLLYTRLLEGSINTSAKSLNTQRGTKILWHEVEYKSRWLDNTLQRNAYKGKTSTEILKWFADKAKEIVAQIEESSNGEPTENSHDNLIAANSMYRITQTIMLNHESNMEQITKKELFALLRCMIADILSACLTNLPRVIVMKCHEGTIEKRGASVEAAIKLLGRTKKIIDKLQLRELPSMDQDQMASIDEWRACLKQPIP